MTGKQRAARYLADTGNGKTRRFSEEVPQTALWAQAVAILATSLAAIAKGRDPDAASIATAALIRAGESVPAVLRDPAVRAGIAVGAALIETRRPESARAISVARIQMPAAPATTSTSSSISTSTPSERSPPAPPDPPRPFGIAELEARLEMLEERRRSAKLRGDHPNVRTIGTQITNTP